MVRWNLEVFFFFQCKFIVMTKLCKEQVYVCKQDIHLLKSLGCLSTSTCADGFLQKLKYPRSSGPRIMRTRSTHHFPDKQVHPLCTVHRKIISSRWIFWNSNISTVDNCKFTWIYEFLHFDVVNKAEGGNQKTHTRTHQTKLSLTFIILYIKFHAMLWNLKNRSWHDAYSTEIGKESNRINEDDLLLLRNRLYLLSPELHLGSPQHLNFPQQNVGKDHAGSWWQRLYRCRTLPRLPQEAEK